MRSVRFQWIGSIVALAMAALACATPDISGLVNTLPSDDFSNSSSGWGTGTDAQSSVEYANGGLQIVVYQPYFVAWSPLSLESYENIHLEVSVTNHSVDQKALFGFVCDEQGTTNSFYYVGVSADGYYAFIKSAVAKDDEYLKEGTSDVISGTPGPMRLGLDCGNGSLTLYVNGQSIDTVSDSTYTSGVLGLFAATQDQESGADVTFDDFVVTKLGE